MKFLTLNIKDHIAYLTVNRPKQYNALSVEVLQEIKEICLQLAENRKIHGMILTGAGEKAFIAGADIKPMQEMKGPEGKAMGALGQEVANVIEAMPFPTVAAVNGFALGGGCELAMACDFILASENAKFGQPEVKLGLIPGFGGCVRFPRYVGAQKAKELIFTGKIINAVEAEKIGLILSVHNNKESLLEEASQLIASIAVQSPYGIRIAKDVINGSIDKEKEIAMTMENEGYRKVFDHQESVEGISAFIEKRQPVFRSQV